MVKEVRFVLNPSPALSVLPSLTEIVLFLGHLRLLPGHTGSGDCSILWTYPKSDGVSHFFQSFEQHKSPSPLFLPRMPFFSFLSMYYALSIRRTSILMLWNEGVVLMVESLSLVAIYLRGFDSMLILEWCSSSHSDSVSSALALHPLSLNWSHMNLEKDKISRSGDSKA